MTEAATGVLRRRAGEPRAPKYRRKPEPQGPFHEEAADQAKREADQQKVDAIRRRAR